jgi:hypothetical protein
MYNNNAGTIPYFHPLHSANDSLPHYNLPPNPYLYSRPYEMLFNPGHGYYMPQPHGNIVSNPVDNHQHVQAYAPLINTKKCGNSIISLGQNINNNTNVFEDLAPFGSFDVCVTTTLMPPKLWHQI